MGSVKRKSGDDGLSESNLYKELGILMKKDQWEENIPYISSLLSLDSVKYSG